MNHNNSYYLYESKNEHWVLINTVNVGHVHIFGSNSSNFVVFGYDCYFMLGLLKLMKLYLKSVDVLLQTLNTALFVHKFELN